MPFLLRRTYFSSTKPSTSLALVFKQPVLVHLDFERDKNYNILEMAAFKARGPEVTDSLRQFISQQQYINNHITACTASLWHQLPSLTVALRLLLTFVDGCRIVAHNATCERFLLNRALRETKLNFDKSLLPSNYICTLRLAQGFFPDCPKFSLQEIIKYLGLPFPNKYHRAETDAIAALQLCCYIQKLLKSKYGIRDEDIVPVLERLQQLPRKERVDIIRKSENSNLKLLLDNTDNISNNKKPSKLHRPI